MSSDGIFSGHVVVGSGRNAPRTWTTKDGKLVQSCEVFVKGYYGRNIQDDDGGDERYVKQMTAYFEPSNSIMNNVFKHIRPGRHLFLVGTHSLRKNRSETILQDGTKQITIYPNETIHPFICRFIDFPVTDNISRVLEILAYEGGLAPGGIKHWMSVVNAKIDGHPVQEETKEEEAASAEEAPAKEEPFDADSKPNENDSEDPGTPEDPPF